MPVNRSQKQQLLTFQYPCRNIVSSCRVFCKLSVEKRTLIDMQVVFFGIALLMLINSIYMAMTLWTPPPENGFRSSALISRLACLLDFRAPAPATATATAPAPALESVACCCCCCWCWCWCCCCSRCCCCSSILRMREVDRRRLRFSDSSSANDCGRACSSTVIV